jgi:hypothetical protein
MDQATQQNAALVEEMAAAASSLKSQAQELVQAVSVFKLTQGTVALQSTAPRQHSASAPSHAPIKHLTAANKAQPAKPKSAKPAALNAPAPHKPAAAPVASATASSEGDWESF